MNLASRLTARRAVHRPTGLADAVLLERACISKVAMGRGAARAVASRVRADGVQRFAAYRCPFCPSWHVGHAPSMTTVQRLAEMIRRGVHAFG